MTNKVPGDRYVLPALDPLLAETTDTRLTQPTAELTAPFRARGTSSQRLRAVLALALDLWTWQRLSHL